MKTLTQLLPKTHQNRIIFLVFIFGLIFTFYNVALMARFENRFLKETAKETVENQHATITPSLADALLYNDIYSIYRIIDTITKNIPFISNIYISDENNKYITDAKVTRKLPSIGSDNKKSKFFKYYTYPINSKLQNIGTIFFEIDQQVLTKQVQERLVKLILLAFAGIILIAYGSFKAVLFLLKPLTNISNSLETVEAKTLPILFDLPDYTSTEVRKLADTIYTMSKSLKKAMDTNVQQQRELAQQEKLAAIGMVSAGLAHELKNPAMTLKLLTQTLMDEQENKNSKDLQIIQQEVNRIVETIDNFQQYSKPVETIIKTVSTEQLVQHIISFAKQYLQNMNISISVAKHIEWLSDESILNVILENLLKNAYEAQATNCFINISETKKSVIISVIDNGYGISEDNTTQIFMPFYSTKSDGTGLGLALVEMMLAKIEGTIKLDCSISQDTKFVIKLRKKL